MRIPTKESIKVRLKTPQGLFVLLSSIFGLFFLFIIPPIQTPDESAHFLRAYQISQGGFVSDKYNGVTGDYLPASLAKTMDILETKTPIQFKPELKYKPGIIKDALRVPLDKDNKSFYDTSAASLYSPIGYMPQSILIAVGSFFNAPPVMLLYLARLGILVVWILLGFLAIKLIPYKKWAVFAILLFPMLVAQSVAIGVDAISIGTALIFIAAILKSTATKAIDRKTMIIIIVVAIAMVMSKQITVVLLPLIFLLKNNIMSSTKRSILFKLLIALAPIIILLCWTFIVGQVSSSTGQVANNQDTGKQISFLLSNPTHFLSVLFNTFFFSWGNSVLQSIIGLFGWVDAALSEIFVAIGYTALAVILFVSYKEDSKVKVQLSIRVMFAILSILYALAVCGAMYLLYSPVGMNIVIGVQGRYLLPILFMLIPVTYGFAITSRRKYVIFVLVSVGILFIASVATIIFRYYIDYRY
jgi:uncharacterized membrane protein